MRATIAIIIIAFVAGLGTRLFLMGGDSAPLLSYITSVLVTGVPASAAWFMSHKTNQKVEVATDKIDTVSDKADQAAGLADTAAQSAVAAEHNTNGKMTAQFAELHSEISGINTLLVSHLAEHRRGERQQCL